jgi:hypothetical protein
LLFQRESLVDCPYCGEPLTVLVDDSVGAQSYYEDCAVCCVPMLIVISENEFGELHIEARRDDE